MTKEALRALVADFLEVDQEQLTDDTKLASFEVYDSVGTLELMVILGDAFGQPVDVAEIAAFRTFGDIARLGRQKGAIGE